MLSISVGLTPKGQARRDDVISYVFSYLDLIRTQGVPEYVIAEVSQLATLFWNYKDADGPRSVIGHAGNMQKYVSPRDWLAGVFSY